MQVKSFVKNGEFGKFENNGLTLINERGKQILGNSVTEENINKYNRMVITYRNKLLFNKILKKYINNNIEINEFISENNQDQTIIKYKLKLNNMTQININHNIKKNKFNITKSELEKLKQKEIIKKLENAHINLNSFLNNIEDISDFELELDLNNIEYLRIVANKEQIETKSLSENNNSEFTTYDKQKVTGELFANGIFKDPKDFLIQYNAYINGNYSVEEIEYAVYFTDKNFNQTETYNNVTTIKSFQKVNTALNVYEKLTATEETYSSYCGAFEKLNNEAASKKEIEKEIKKFLNFLENFDSTINKYDLKKYTKIKIYPDIGMSKKTYLQIMLDNYFNENKNNYQAQKF